VRRSAKVGGGKERGSGELPFPFFPNDLYFLLELRSKASSDSKNSPERCEVDTQTRREGVVEEGEGVR